jgi:hypothetical protein
MLNMSSLPHVPGDTFHAVFHEAARQVVEAHDAFKAAIAGEVVDEAIEAEKHLEAAVERLRALLVEGEGA